MKENSLPLPSRTTQSQPGDSSHLDGLTFAVGLGPAKAGQDVLIGQVIGGVTVTRLIAEGGMGRVYEGNQEKPKRTVAVKFMRPGVTSQSLLKRFEYEANLLARLQHPAIAQIYTSGVHVFADTPIPYFVMEYVPDAIPITTYATKNQLSVSQRLELFQKACEGVAHGHQKGVIHRDLKPGNILVDAEGMPKVIDFGVACATDSDMNLTTMKTEVGQLVGTLQYMSPEQVHADPNDIDVRSDVYSLGIILYELLAGKLPYDVERKAVLEVVRIVKEEDPLPLTSLDNTIPRDLSAIAGKCLVKERNGRYSSASHLSQDITKYINGAPIDAVMGDSAMLRDTLPDALLLTLLRQVTSRPGMWDIVKTTFNKVAVLKLAVAELLLSCVNACSPIAAGRQLELNGLTTLSPDVARVLAKLGGRLSLNGLTTLSLEVAQALVKHDANLDLDGLTSLSLDGLTTLSPDVAQVLATNKGDLSFDGLTTLSLEVAQALAEHKGGLSFHKLTCLSPEVAQALAEHDGDLGFNGATTLSPDVAQVLAKHKGDLSFNSLTTLSLEVAQALAEHKGHLSFPKLRSLSPEVAQALAEHDGDLGLWGLTTLSPEVARVLAKHKGCLSFFGLTTLSLEVAQALAEHKGGLRFHKIDSLSLEVAQALAEHKERLSFHQLPGLSLEVAQALAKHSGRIHLGGLNTLLPDVAQALAKHDGELNLGGLSTRSPAAADLVATHKGDGILQPMVEPIDDPSVVFQSNRPSASRTAIADICINVVIGLWGVLVLISSVSAFLKLLR